MNDLKFTLMCHRPRSQRIGEGSKDQELEVLTVGDYIDNKLDLAVLSLRTIANEQLRNNGEGQIFSFQILPNDEFYLKVELDYE